MRIITNVLVEKRNLHFCLKNKSILSKSMPFLLTSICLLRSSLALLDCSVALSNTFSDWLGEDSLLLSELGRFVSMENGDGMGACSIPLIPL